MVATEEVKKKKSSANWDVWPTPIEWLDDIAKICECSVSTLHSDCVPCRYECGTASERSRNDECRCHQPRHSNLCWRYAIAPSVQGLDTIQADDRVVMLLTRSGR
jgi:hypothetical protein